MLVAKTIGWLNHEVPKLSLLSFINQVRQGGRDQTTLSGEVLHMNASLGSFVWNRNIHFTWPRCTMYLYAQTQTESRMYLCLLSIDMGRRYCQCVTLMLTYSVPCFQAITFSTCYYHAALGKLSKTFQRNSSVKGGGYPPFPLRKKTFFFSD